MSRTWAVADAVTLEGRLPSLHKPICPTAAAACKSDSTVGRWHSNPVAACPRPPPEVTSNSSRPARCTGHLRHPGVDGKIGPIP